MKVDELIEKYKLAPDSYELEKDRTVAGMLICNHEWNLQIEKGWYGFDLSYKTPQSWYLAIHDFLRYVYEKCPDFKILQIKTKWGGLRMYLDKINPEIEAEISKLEGVLHDKKLIY